MSSRAAYQQQGCPEDKVPVQTGAPDTAQEGGRSRGRKEVAQSPLQTEHSDHRASALV